MKIKFIILGCGYSLGVPRADGNWGKCEKSGAADFRAHRACVVRCRGVAMFLDPFRAFFESSQPDISKNVISAEEKSVTPPASQKDPTLDCPYTGMGGTLD